MLGTSFTEAPHQQDTSDLAFKVSSALKFTGGVSDSWSIKVTYEDFAGLHAQLASERGRLQKPLPRESGQGLWQGLFQGSASDRLAKKLAAWMNETLASPSLQPQSSLALIQFLGIHDHPALEAQSQLWQQSAADARAGRWAGDIPPLLRPAGMRASELKKLPGCVMHEGWMLKRATSGKTGVLKQPQRRYFVLSWDGLLSYFTSPSSTEPKGTIALTADFFTADSLTSELGIQLSDLVQTAYFETEGIEEKMQWMYKISAVVKVLEGLRESPAVAEDPAPVPEASPSARDSKEVTPKSARASVYSLMHEQVSTVDKELQDTLQSLRGSKGASSPSQTDAAGRASRMSAHMSRDPNRVSKRESVVAQRLQRESATAATVLTALTAGSAAEGRASIAGRKKRGSLEFVFEVVAEAVDEGDEHEEEKEDEVEAEAPEAEAEAPEAEAETPEAEAETPEAEGKAPKAEDKAPKAEDKASEADAKVADAGEATAAETESVGAMGASRDAVDVGDVEGKEAKVVEDKPAPAKPAFDVSDADAGMGHLAVSTEPSPEPKVKPTLNTTSKPNSATKLMAAKFDQSAEQAAAESKANPFSAHFDRSASKLKKGDAGYGQAPAGSLTEARAKAAQAWVDKEIDALIQVIEEKGKINAGTGKAMITFGEIFDLYADISDSLVGILMRAKKRKRLMFEAGMLFQGVHDAVEIKVL